MRRYLSETQNDEDLPDQKSLRRYDSKKNIKVKRRHCSMTDHKTKEDAFDDWAESVLNDYSIILPADEDSKY